MRKRRINHEDLYLDQAHHHSRHGDRVFFAAYTPYGIHTIDSLYMRRIRAGHGSKAKLRAEIAANPHLHKDIKDNLIGNLDNLFNRYKRSPASTYIPPGSFVMIRDCEFDRDLRPRYLNDHVRGPYRGDMLSDHAGDLGVVEWYEASGNLSVCIQDGYHGGGEHTYLGHERATFRHEELEVLWESPYHQS